LRAESFRIFKTNHRKTPSEDGTT